MEEGGGCFEGLMGGVGLWSLVGLRIGLGWDGLMVAFWSVVFGHGVITCGGLIFMSAILERLNVRRYPSIWTRAGWMF